jgi:hypothetical protein
MKQWLYSSVILFFKNTIKLSAFSRQVICYEDMGEFTPLFLMAIFYYNEKSLFGATIHGY